MFEQIAEFGYDTLWNQERDAKAQRNEALWEQELQNERMTLLLGEDWEALLSDPVWVARENERRAQKNAEYEVRYPISYELDLDATIFANQNPLARVIHAQSWNPKRFNRILRERFLACCLILNLPWKDYKYLTLMEISEMTGLSRQKVRAMVDILLDGNYLKQVKNGFRKVRKSYKAK